MRALVVLAALAFITYLGWALLTHDTATFSDAMSHPWAKVVVADFYLGIFSFAALVWAAEGFLPALVWGGATTFLGNPVTAAWVAFRGIPLLMKLREAQIPAEEPV